MAMASVAANAAKQKAAQSATSKAAERMNKRKNAGGVPGQGKHSKNYSSQTKPQTTLNKAPAKRDGRGVSEKVSDKTSGFLGNRPRYWEPRTVAGYRRILTAEFIVCVFVVIYKAYKSGGSSLASTGNKSFWRQIGAVWLAFFALALLSSVSWKMARICAMLGGLIVVVMLLKDSQILTTSFSTAQSAFGTAPVNQEG